MAPVNLFLIVFLALIVWRFVFAALRCRPWVRAIAERHQPRNYLFDVGLHISGLEGDAINAGNRFENRPSGLAPLDPKDRAKAYLRRILALTGATQMGGDYVLDVGAARF